MKKRLSAAFTRTDLACEVCDGLSGVVCCEEANDIGELGVTVSRLRIETRAAAQRLGRPRGNYITIASPKSFSDFDEISAAAFSDILKDELRRMTEEASGERISSAFGVLIAGLGNAAMTADTVGPECARKVAATRHLRELEKDIYASLGCAAVSVVTPGVLGETGIESAELLKGAVRAARPNMVIAVDALAARSCERLGKTIQLSDVGMTPGSGVGNTRCAIDKKTLGVPVLSIGVPTVVDSSTLVWEALCEAEIVDDRADALPGGLERVLENGRSFFVSPRDADILAKKAAGIIADAIESLFVIR